MAMRAWWLLLFCLLCAPVPAAVPEIPRFRLLGAGDGLPSTTIPALARDRAGHLWIATWDGLARYDGVSFKIWRHDPADPASLPGNVVQALHIDASDRIWVATENGGLSVMEADRRGFRHYRQAQHPQMGSDDVFAITSHDRDIWFGTFGGGLHRLGADGRITRFAAAAEGADGLPSDNVLSLAFDAEGVLWVGTMGGLARYEGGQLRRLALPGGDGLIIYSVTADGDAMWVGAADGVHRWLPDGRWVSPPWSPMFARPNALIAMTSDGQGEYWLASQGGLWRTEGDRAPAPVNYDAQNVGIGRVLQTVLALPDGGLWVPVPTRGLAYLRSDWRRIAAFSSAQGLGGGLYRGLSQADADGIWIASSTGKVERLDTRNGHVTPLPHHAASLGELRLTSIRQDRRGQLWIGHRSGLIRIDPRTGASVTWGQEGEDAVPDNTSVDWLVEAPDNTLWLVSQMGSVQQREIASGRVLRTIAKQEDGGGLPDIEGIAVAPDGHVWLGGAAGMMVWDAVAGRFVAQGTMGNERVYAFAFEHADRLWLHRMSGVEAWRRDGGRWVRERLIGAEQGLPAVESTGLAVDLQRRVWLGTRRGLFRIDPNLHGSRALLRNFGVREGLLSQELNDRGLLMTADGLLATTAADGSVSLLDTHLPDPKPITPNLVLDSLQVSRGDDVVHLRIDQPLELQPEDHELLVGTRLLSYENPLGNRYRSMLDGFDSGWVDQGASGERVFSTLTPGRYRLRVQAYDAAGNASRELVLSVHVLPPWWRSPWGMALFAVVGVLLLLAAAAAYRRRVRRRSAWQLAEHKRELAEQASLAKTRFLATLGHEIRTPMTGVLGMTELLQATPLDERQRGYTNAIQRAGTHLLRLVNDALDLAKIEAGKLELQQLDFDLHALLADVVALMGPVAGKRGLAFHDGVAAGVPRLVRGDPLRLRQILLNLLGNAIKFTEAGHVSLHAVPLAPHGVRLTVGDTGPGINAEQQERLFRRFEQAEGAQTTARYGGSGLGLAICQELAVAMGGRIDVDSAPGKGTRFSVDLPALQLVAPGEAQDVPLADTTSAPADVGALDILLVEDDVTVADVVAGLLRARGHRVTHAPHGLAALTEVVTTVFDIAFLDLDLPGLDGMALARQLRLHGVTTPLIALTARTDAEAEPLARQAGFDDFVRKPVTGDMLAEVIASQIERGASAERGGNVMKAFTRCLGVVVLCLLAGVARADAPEPPLLGDYITETRALYPLRVEGWEAIGEKRYEQQELGVSVRYQDTRKPDRWMDLYLYPAGVVFDPVFERVFQQSVDEIVQIARERNAGDVRLGETRSFATAPVGGESMLGGMAVKARSFAMEIPMRDTRYRSALAMTVRDLYFIKVRYSVEAGSASDEDVQKQAEAFLAGFAANVRVFNTGRCRQVMQVRDMPHGDVRPESVMASTNDGREDEMWIADDAVYLRPAVIARAEQAAKLRDEAQSVRDVLRGRCVAPEAMEIAVPDGMREIRFEYRAPPERTDGTTPRLRSPRSGLG